MQRQAGGIWAWPWERISALAGVAAVVLWVIGAWLLFSNEPQEGTGQEVLAYFRENEGTIIAGAWIFGTGFLLFFWFLSALRARFLAVEGPLGRATTLSFAAGVAVTILAIMLPAVNATGAFEGDDMTPAAAEALWVIGGVFFGSAELMGVLFLAATGVAILITRVLPRWWGWITLLLAVWLFILPIGWAGMLLGVPIWVAVTSILLALRPGVGVAAERTAPPPEPVV